MLFAPHPSTKSLAEFLRRMSTSLEAGIDIRKVLSNEARRSSDAMRSRVQDMSDMINGGSSFSAALDATGEYFPELTRELVAVGEQTGHLPEVLKQLSEHYDEQMALRRMFMSTIAWPMVQLVMSLCVVGFLIWISAVIGRMNGGNTIDFIGLGLTGESGLLIYVIFLGVVGFGIFWIYQAIITGKIWVAPIQRAIMKIPGLGGAFRTLAIARFAWVLHITTSVALDVKRALHLAVRSTHNVEFTDHDKRMQASIQRGEPIHEAMTETGAFPIELIHSVQVGEESGRLAETLELVAKQQFDAARRALAVLTRFAGWGVWAMVACLIIVLIFRMASIYIGNLNEALNWANHAGVRH
jgi:type IV pilus assembly protein PilC